MNADTPVFSVIVPVYKVEQYLRRCIESILTQSFEDFEAILVDDGSPDECGDICDEYAAKDERIRIIHQENMGLSGARNTGIANARGEYLVFVDSDDYVESTMLAGLHAKIQSDNKPDVLLYGYTTLAREMTKYFVPDLVPLEQIKYNIFTDTWHAYAWNKCFKRSFFKYEFPLGKKFEDLYITPIILWEAKSISLIPETYYVYNCLNENSITAAKSADNEYEVIESYKHILAYAKAHNIQSVQNKIIERILRTARKSAIKILASGQPNHQRLPYFKEVLTQYQHSNILHNLRVKFWIWQISNRNHVICRKYAQYRHYFKK